MALNAIALALALASTSAEGAGAIDLPVAQPALGPTQTIAAKSDEYDRMTVPVTVREHGPFRFMVDTGAQRTVLSDMVAARLGVTGTDQAQVTGVAGTRVVSVVDVGHLKLGRRSWAGKQLPILLAHDVGADGIIGLDGLQGQRVMIDFRRNEVTLIDRVSRDPAADGFEIVVEAKRHNGELIMTNALIDGVRVDVVIDTGSDISVGNRALQKALGSRVTGHTELQSVTGQSIQADYATARQFSIDGFKVTGMPIAFTDSPSFALMGLDRRPAVLLGMPTLRLFDRIAIDFVAKRVLFDMPATSIPSS
ncbi:retroviral-like aspartic protease family protein [Novosphingobium sp. KACC 22771]|uniref:retroviral-like aspartic protease family protein n=1 Tax=Novosphingobium sp. KACC 22771 TaxID=3025670 RepID=UPI0023667F2C|nr:retroviral-like aspartic protease family protein [Novosphingobium sp. KACC 22771]WDF72469.1 retroviral-like aspartic protease family protein [Novosphingobium sp. KACC 22771]